jgi:hypothetical protein
VIALSHAGPEWWVLALAAGFGGGIVVTVLVLLLLRWRRHLRTLQVEAEQLLPIEATAPESGAAPPTNTPATPDADSREPMRDADYGALFAPPKPGTPTAQRLPLAPLRPPPEAIVPADHEMWAPPEDRGDR